MKKRHALLLALWATLGSGAWAEEAGPDGLTQQQLSTFMRSLQAAIKANDPAPVAALVSFPLRVNAAGGKHRSLSSAQLRSEYERVFTPAVRTAILQQDDRKLFRNSNGAMIGEGEVWLSGICADAACARSDIRIISVNTAKP